MRIIGIDPGLNNTGWGIIDKNQNTLSYIACGVIKTLVTDTMGERLLKIDAELDKIIELFKPESAAIEETFMNKSGSSTIKLGMARGVAFLAPARAGIDIAEYSANKIKKSVVGAGHADKTQVQMMVKVLLPKADCLNINMAELVTTNCGWLP